VAPKKTNASDGCDSTIAFSRPLFCSWCPPNPSRMAESTRLEKSASPRELKRANSDAASTGTGTPTSMAASTVQRPSPESATRPAKPSSVALLPSWLARRSSSQELHDAAMTPQLGDLIELEVEAVSLLLGWSRLGVDDLRARVGTDLVQDIEALGIGGHEAVLDAIVHHLHEMAGAAGTHMKVAALRRLCRRSCRRRLMLRIPARAPFTAASSPPIIRQ